MATFSYLFDTFVDKRTRIYKYISVDSITGGLANLKVLLEKESIFISHNIQISKNVRKINIIINIVSIQKITMLNKAYRSQNQPTDVLSFNYDDTISNILFLGELYLCPSFIRIMSNRFKTTFRYEFWQDLVHGILHLHGFEHGKSMFNLQNRILREILV